MNTAIAGRGPRAALTTTRRTFSARRVFAAAVWAVLVANVAGTAAALIQNVPGPPVGALARDTWVFGGTAYSAPLFLIVLTALALAVSGRRGWIGVVGTSLPMLISALADLSLTSDWPGYMAAITHHFNLVGFVASWVLILVSPIVVVSGTLDLWSRRSSRS